MNHKKKLWMKLTAASLMTAAFAAHGFLQSR